MKRASIILFALGALGVCAIWLVEATGYGVLRPSGWTRDLPLTAILIGGTVTFIAGALAALLTDVLLSFRLRAAQARHPNSYVVLGHRTSSISAFASRRGYPEKVTLHLAMVVNTGGITFVVRSTDLRLPLEEINEVSVGRSVESPSVKITTTGAGLIEFLHGREEYPSAPMHDVEEVERVVDDVRRALKGIEATG